MENGSGENYWSRFANSYDTDGEYVVGKAILQAIEGYLGDEVLLGNAVEFGCGTGYFTKAVAQNARHVIATDFSDEMLKVAQSTLGEFANVEIQKADCRDSSFSAESFDSAILVNLLHVIDEPSQCLQETNRILRKQGRLIAIDFTGYRLRFLKKVKLVLRYLSRWGRPPRNGKNDLSPEELVHLVENAGFEVTHIQLLEGGANALYLKGVKR